MFPKENESYKHTESVPTEDNHTAVDHKYEEFSYSKLSSTYVQHSYSLDVGKHFERSKTIDSALVYVIVEQNMDLVEDNEQVRKDLKGCEA